MSLQVLHGSKHDRAAALEEMNLCIAEAEVSSCAQAHVISILAMTGYDTTEALRVLYVDMDALAALRVVRGALRSDGPGIVPIH